jgi:hypothetical protein
MLARFCETSCCPYWGANKTRWRSVGLAKRRRGYPFPDNPLKSFLVELEGIELAAS